MVGYMGAVAPIVISSELVKGVIEPIQSIQLIKHSLSFNRLRTHVIYRPILRHKVANVAAETLRLTDRIEIAVNTEKNG